MDCGDEGWPFRNCYFFGSVLKMLFFCLMMFVVR